MSFQYIPFHFSAFPKIRCAFQFRSYKQINSANDLNLETYNFGQYSTREAARVCMDGNISFCAEDLPERVWATRKDMQDILGFSAFAETKQVHGDRVIFEPNPASFEKPSFEEADAMATSQKDFALMIKTADCQPILIAHMGGEHILALHVGWRGNRMGFPMIAIEKFCERYRLDPKDLMAVRGPSLGPYRSEFVDFAKEWPQEFKTWYDEESKCMDLWLLTHQQLILAGLEPRNIFSLDLCTSTMCSTFFSYRINKKCGRQASLIWIEK